LATQSGGIFPPLFLLDMKQDELHVTQDEWSYTTTKTSARTKVKRTRAKAKRQLSKKLIARELTK